MTFKQGDIVQLKEGGALLVLLQPPILNVRKLATAYCYAPAFNQVVFMYLTSTRLEGAQVLGNIPTDMKYVEPFLKGYYLHEHGTQPNTELKVAGEKLNKHR